MKKQNYYERVVKRKQNIRENIKNTPSFQAFIKKKKLDKKQISKMIHALFLGRDYF